MKPLLICLLCFLSWSIQAQQARRRAVASVLTQSRVYLLKEGFEGVGYENVGWTEDGTPNEDYTMTVLEGVQSLNCVSVAATSSTLHSFTASGEVWGYFLFRPNTITVAYVFQFADVGANNKVVFYLDATGHLTVSDYIVFNPQTTVDAMSSGVTYHVWVHYKKGTGADGVADIGFSTDGTRPTSGNKFAAQTNCGFTVDAGNALVGISLALTGDLIYDKLRIDSVLIGSNPE